ALRIGRTLVTERLVACANVLPGMRSIYRWQGAIEEADETLLVAKTRKDLAETVIARVKALHSYDVPCAVVYDMAGGLPAYLDWIDVSIREV
ncbi:MAG: divalent-cation tolerance protein CutA, partial [Prosthecobacter sp.]|nr:divalent-cation tolerance protein CutA [Prosthecobacter sp.]